jgi:glucose-1-phosphate cytidylyltransferase
MKIYSTYGINDFVVCCGFKGYVIKEYFSNYFLHMSDVTFDMQNNQMEVHHRTAEPWKVTLVDTGESTMTGGRIKRIEPFIDGDFCLTYGDGLADVNLKALIDFHYQQKSLCTLTAVQPPGRFGALDMNVSKVRAFKEKPHGDGSWINGGFFICSPKIMDYIEGDSTIWERKPLEMLASQDELSAYLHKGFWQPMDTLRDKLHLELLWDTEKAPWKVW